MSAIKYTFLFLIFFTACGSNNKGDGLKLPFPFDDSLSGTDIGNGGDLIRCQKQLPLFPFEADQAWYVLDYAEIRVRGYSFIQRQSVEGYLLNVRNIISKGAPIYLSSFDDYIKSVPFLNSYEEGLGSGIVREWISTEKNEEINDEDPGHIAPNCREYRSKSLKFHQVVVRKELFNSNGELAKVEYLYDTSLIRKIGDKPLQLSLLIVHEWLWDFYNVEKEEEGFRSKNPPFYSNSRRLRSANRALHYTSSAGLSSNEIQQLLNLTN